MRDVTTPDGRARSATVIWSPMSRALTSTSMLFGRSPGLASIDSVKVACSRRPPSRTPGASPVRWMGTSADTAWSRRTRMKSRCTSVWRTGWRTTWRASTSSPRPDRSRLMRVLAPPAPARMCWSSRLGTATGSGSAPWP